MKNAGRFERSSFRITHRPLGIYRKNGITIENWVMFSVVNSAKGAQYVMAIFENRESGGNGFRLRFGAAPYAVSLGDFSSDGQLPLLLNSLPNGQGALAVLKSRHGGFGGVLGPYSVASRARNS